MNTPRPTLKDVAAHAGVGTGTVSRVLNDQPRVSARSRASVLEAIDALGYRRNGAAATLRRGGPVSVGLLVEDVADPFYSQLGRAVEETALESGWVLFFVSSAGDAGRARRYVRALLSRGVDGLIITPPSGGASLSDFGIRTPTVMIDRPSHGGTADQVLTDNRGGAATATRFLLDRGHRRIACFTDRADLFTAAERLAGYRNALKQSRIGFDELLVHSGAPNDAEITGALGLMMASEDPPTAIFSANNRMSVAVLRAIRRAGLRLEQVGFDDLELAELLDPPLSVVAQDPALMGRTAARLLADRLSGSMQGPRTIVLPPRLLQRL